MTVAAPGISLAGQPLASVIVRDSTVYEPAQLFGIYQAHLGQPVTRETAASIAASVQQRYLDDGYSRPGYTILDSGVETGLVRMRLVEARISDVRITGNPGPWGQKLESLVGQLDSQQSLRPSDVRNALRRARRLPGLEVSIATEPGPEQGAYMLSVDSSFRPLEGGVTLSNRGTREIGRTLLTARLVSNGLLGSKTANGLFVTTAQDSDDYLGGGLFSSAAIGDRGASIQLLAAVTSLATESAGIALGQERERVQLRYSRPLLESHDHELGLRFELDVENLDVVQASLTSREERLRSIETGLLLNLRSGSSQQLAGLDVEQGLRGFGARIDHFLSSAKAPEADFTILRFHYVHVRRLGETLILRWDAIGQHSADVLPSIKQFKVGGSRIGRGFEAAAASGDRGIGNKLELKRRLTDSVSWLTSTDLYGYYDLGTTWRNNAPGRESASSMGIGVAWTAERLGGYVEVAQPLTHADVDGRTDASIFAELSFRF